MLLLLKQKAIISNTLVSWMGQPKTTCLVTHSFSLNVAQPTEPKYFHILDHEKKTSSEAQTKK